MKIEGRKWKRGAEGNGLDSLEVVLSDFPIKITFTAAVHSYFPLCSPLWPS